MKQKLSDEVRSSKLTKQSIIIRVTITVKIVEIVGRDGGLSGF